MKIVTTRDMIRSIASSWKHQYEVCLDERSRFSGETKRATLEKLEALDVETVTKEDVDAIIGNKSWTTLYCDECSQCADAIVIVGEEPSFDTATAKLCMKCLQKAYDLCKEQKLL